MPKRSARRSARSAKRRSPKKLRDLQSKYIREEFHAVARGDYVPTAKGANRRRQIIAIGMSKGRAAYKRSLRRSRK